MGSTIVDLLPFMIGAALAPVWVILTLLLLSSKGGLLKGAAFVAGVIGVRLLQGWLGSLIFSTTNSDAERSGVIGSTLLMVLGLLLLSTAYKTWTKEPDPDAPPPKWMSMFETATPLQAMSYGALGILIAPKMWVFTLGAMSAIRENGLSGSEATVAFLIYVLGASILILTPVVITALAPKRAGTMLTAASSWLERNNRVIVIVVSLIFGVFFLWNGLSGLLG